MRLVTTLVSVVIPGAAPARDDRAVRLFVMLATAVILGAAPAQCGDPEPIRYARRDDPAEVVYLLGQRLEARGEHRAAHETWRFLLDRYPATRWAERARMRLEATDAGPAVEEP